MIKKDKYHWNDEVIINVGEKGRYIAISGNTGAGKSSLVKAITSHLEKRAINIIGINERVLHHPLLKFMFHAPSEYGFLIQLNFLIQRHIILHRWLSAGYTVVIERSHLDDKLFVEHLYTSRHINKKEYEIYLTLSGILGQKLPEPDFYIFLSATTEVSLERLRKSEDSGERPREFPNEEVKKAFVTSWHEKYNIFYNDLVSKKEKGLCFQNTFFKEFNAENKLNNIVTEVLRYLNGLT